MVKILLVEDALEMAASIKRTLEADGHIIKLAADGETALTLFEKDPPDLIILDWMLPGIDGLAVLRHIRVVSAVPVLMLSALSEVNQRVMGLEVGADDYLAKPFDAHELRARVRALLRRTEMIQQTLLSDRQQRQGKVSYGTMLMLDPDSREATLHDQPLALTQTEFDLLYLFLQNPGRAFSRAYLLDAIWGENYFSGDRSVDNAMLRLRSKLEGLSDAIETVWGVGYRLKKPS